MPSTRTAMPETSHEAEASITNTRAIYAAIMHILSTEGPMTDTTLRERYKSLRRENGWGPIAESTIRARRAELVDRGLVMDTGDTQRLTTGRRSTVWGMAQA